MSWHERCVEGLLWAVAICCLILGRGTTDDSAGGYVPAARAPGGLRIVTWNVGGENGGGLAPAAVAHVSATLRDLDGDIVFLQEVGDEAQLRAVLDGLGPGWRGELARGRDRRVAGIVQMAPGVRTRTRSIRTGTRRRSLLIEYRRPEAPVLWTMGLHADALSSTERNRQIGQTLERLLADAGDGPCLLAGDLNIDLDLDKRRDMFSDDAHLDVESYNYITRELFDVGVNRGSTAEPDRRLDYIFISAQLGVRDAGPVRGRRQGAMDHDPVVADLEWME